MNFDFVLGDKKYISVSRASKETGYTSDYIGQLCRQGKVPSKLVGRAWYVDLSDLQDYQKNIANRNSKKTANTIFRSSDLVLPRSDKDVLNIKYESDVAPELPVFKKKGLKKKNSYTFLFNSRIIKSTAFAISFFVFSGVVFSWINFLSPSYTEKIDQKIASSYNRILLAFNNFNEGFQVAQVKESFSKNVSTFSKNGVVAFPDSKNRQNEINMVKNAFSDEMEVSFDDTGESGVIRPVFRSSKDTEDYAFVLVPIKEKK